jgi:tetratricopeptide (TPR) repeat protein
MRDFKYSPPTLVHFESGDLEQGLEVAVALLDEARRRADEPAAILQHLEEVTEFAIRLERCELAIDARQEMLARNAVQAGSRPSEAQVEDLARLGYYYYLNKDWPRAEEYLQRGLEAISQLPADERQEFPTLWTIRCRVAWAQQDLTLALKHLLEAYRMHIRYTRWCWRDAFCFQRNYGKLLQEMGQWTKAARTCQIALKLAEQPDLPPHTYLAISSLHYLRGIIFYHDHDYTQALSALQRATELLQQAPRRYPLDERRGAEKCAAAITKVQAKLNSSSI